MIHTKKISTCLTNPDEIKIHSKFPATKITINNCWIDRFLFTLKNYTNISDWDYILIYSIA